MKLGVFGTGRFGSFWATKLAEKSDVLTYNRSDRPVPEGTVRGSLTELGTCDAVVLCVAISAIRPALEALVPVLKPGCVVMDTCSVKVYPSRLMSELVPMENPVIGTHPMFGPDSANGGLTGLPFVYSPVRCDDAEGARWKSFYRSLDVTVLEMTPDEHDREAAFTQGVTHFLGRVLADMNLADSTIATVGYKKLLQVVEQTCNDPYQLFVDLQRFNPHTSEMRGMLKESLGRMMNLLETSIDTGEPQP